MKVAHSGAFSLLEVMVAVALGGVLAATVVATFSGSIRAQSRAKHEWQAFTIAQQQMETLAAIRRDAPALSANASTTPLPGTPADATCAGIPAAQHFKVNELGQPTANGAYELCWRVTPGSPSSELKNVRVVVLFNSNGEQGHVLLQTIR